MKNLSLLALLTAVALHSDDSSWIEVAQSRTDADALALGRTLASPDPLSRDQFRSLLMGEAPHAPCSTAPMPTHDTPSILVFVSFSLPASTWRGLSAHLEEVGGAFVIRGLPDNSFSTVSRRLQELHHQGVRAPILLDPRLFTDYEVIQVPTFVVTAGDHFDKVTGNVTLPYALHLISERGETPHLGEAS